MQGEAVPCAVAVMCHYDHLGGTGNDLIRAGSGRDVILFNRGDGADTVIADRAGDNTLSFGGGIRYSDLRLSRSGKDLVLNAGVQRQEERRQPAVRAGWRL